MNIEDKRRALRAWIEELSRYKLFVKMAREATYTWLAPKIYEIGQRDMERDLGKLIIWFSEPEQPSMNHIDKFEGKIAEHIVTEIIFEELCERVIKAWKVGTP